MASPASARIMLPKAPLLPRRASPAHGARRVPGVVARRAASSSSSSPLRRLLTPTRRMDVSSGGSGNRLPTSLAFRRTYADAAPAPAPAPARSPRRFRFFRYLWRATYLSAILGVAYLGYGVWELRHPEEQREIDPTKKNLVILGMRTEFLLPSYPHRLLTICRIWLGSCIAAKKSEHGKF